MRRLSHRKRAVFVGMLIIAAYSMLAYDITLNAILGVSMDIFSGLSVFFIAFLMFPLFRKTGHSILNVLYFLARSIEGLLMIAAGLLILSPDTVAYRALVYQYIHVYFFIAGAVLFYFLCFYSRIIPRFISLWGIAAAGLLFVSNIINLTGIIDHFADLLVVPMILNELFLAFWLIIKGFSKDFE